jgi:maltooligosyltrehalose synthase
MSKLNKSQSWELINAAIQEVAHNSSTVKKGKEDQLVSEILSALVLLSPKTGGGSSTKINAAGEVFCNYYQQYFPADSFAKKLGKPNKITGERKEVYKSNCLLADTILRRIKALKASVNKQLLENFKYKIITADEMQEVMDRLDEVTSVVYNDVTEVPTVADVTGLTDAIK